MKAAEKQIFRYVLRRGQERIRRSFKVEACWCSSRVLKHTPIDRLDAVLISQMSIEVVLGRETIIDAANMSASRTFVDCAESLAMIVELVFRSLVGTIELLFACTT